MSSRRRFLKSVGFAAVAATGACASRHQAFAPAAAPVPAEAVSTLVRIGSNENAYGPGRAAREAIGTALADANRYPFRAVGSLAEAIAASHGLSGVHVMSGSGSSELLVAAVSAFTSADRHLVSASPTFELPADRARDLGRRVVDVRVDASGRLDLDGMAAAAQGAGLVYLCNPNNPTATVHDAADVTSCIDAVQKRSPDAIVLVDEAYHEYVAAPGYRTAVARAAADPRVIVTRTFSKIHGMAGLRVGYAIGAPETIRRLALWVDPMNLNVLGVAAARASLGDVAHLEEQRVANAVGRKQLRDALATAGYPSFESDANFVMVHVRRDLRSFAAACLSRGVQVARPFPPLVDYARITVGTTAEMARAIPVFLDVLSAPAVPVTASAWVPDGFGC